MNRSVQDRQTVGIQTYKQSRDRNHKLQRMSKYENITNITANTNTLISAHMLAVLFIPVILTKSPNS